MYACIYIPDFPLQAIVRHEPALRERPVAIVEGTPPLCKVIVVNRQGREAGATTGMTRLEATQCLALSFNPSMLNRRERPASESERYCARYSPSQCSSERCSPPQSLRR